MQHLKTFNTWNTMNEAKVQDVETFAEKTFDDPKFKIAVFDAVTSLTPQQVEKAKAELNKLGITAETSPEEILSKLVDASESIQEGNEQSRVASLLHNVGAANISAWGGVPAAIAIGAALAGTVGSPVAAGFAISWGATVLLMSIAKLLGHKN